MKMVFSAKKSSECRTFGDSVCENFRHFHRPQSLETSQVLLKLELRKSQSVLRVMYQDREVA